MPKKLIIDCDPGIDDAIALCWALFDPRVEVLAVTATPGSAVGRQATRNVQSIIEQLDPDKWPRVGATQDDSPIPAFAKQVHGDDGLGSAAFSVSQLHHQHLSDKVITDVLRSEPEGEVTVVAMGPLTNIARALSREPSLAASIGRIVMTGGSAVGIGDITAVAEYNMFFDPEGAEEVFRSPTTKTLVPLEITRQVAFRMDFLDELPGSETRAGKLLGPLVPFAFRTYRQFFGLEGIYLHAAVALCVAIEPEWFRYEEMAGHVETEGEFTRGMTVFDRRVRPEWRPNMDMVSHIDAAAVRTAIIRGLKYAGQRTT